MRMPEYRFDEESHTYTLLSSGARLPNITRILNLAGLVTDQWYTEESSVRGQAAHKLAADVDLGSLDVDGCVSAYRGYLLAWVEIMRLVPHEWYAVEEVRVSERWRFAGRLDRIGKMWGLSAVCEIKTGDVEPKSHPIQTALQAILAADELRLPPEDVQRYAVYLRPNGRGFVEEHRNRFDLVRARGYLERYCR